MLRVLALPIAKPCVLQVELKRRYPGHLRVVDQALGARIVCDSRTCCGDGAVAATPFGSNKARNRKLSIRITNSLLENPLPMAIGFAEPICPRLRTSTGTVDCAGELPDVGEKTIGCHGDGRTLIARACAVCIETSSVQPDVYADNSYREALTRAPDSV